MRRASLVLLVLTALFFGEMSSGAAAPHPSRGSDTPDAAPSGRASGRRARAGGSKARRSKSKRRSTKARRVKRRRQTRRATARRAGRRRATRVRGRRAHRRHPRRARYVYRHGVWVAVPAPVYHDTVVVHHEAPVDEVLVEESAPAPRRRDSFRRVGVMLRLGALSFAPAKDAVDSDDLTLGAVGGALRVNLDRHWAVELAGEFAGSEDDGLGIRRQTNPVTGSLVLNLLPNSFLNLYGVAGLGGYFTQVQALDYGYTETYNRVGGHVGGGAELRLSPGLRLFADLRFIGVGNPTNREVTHSRSAPPSELILEEGNRAVHFAMGMAAYF